MDNNSAAAYEGLSGRNQFVLGPFFLEGHPTWKRLKVNDSFCLSVHQDLPAYQTREGNKSVTLLGFILDPDNPGADDPAVIDGLLRLLSGCGSFCEQTYRFGGRWVLIIDDGRDVRLFNDAAGMRQVFYSDPRQTGDLWCASQPGMIAEILDVPMDRGAVDFIDSYEFRNHREYRWPADSSPFRGIRHMLPNHFLDLKTGDCRRFWPEKPLRRVSLDEAVERVSGDFLGLMRAAGQRFDLAVSVTAGLDSRMVFASSLEMRDRLHYMTVRQIGMPDDHADVTVPSRMLPALGLEHEIVKSSFIMPEEFVRIFRKNVPFAHDVYLPDAYAIWRAYRGTKVAVTGGVSEIARSDFRRKLKKSRHEQVTSLDLAKLQNMGRQPFAVDSFERWLADAGEIYNFDILDLFEWEQGHGNWLAMCQLEFDTAWKDIFTPFNCRRLLVDMLSVDEMHRNPPKYELFESLIFRFWPEALTFPINPHRQKRASISSSLRSGISVITPGFIKYGLRKANIIS
ncbi:MAG: hypothetical protein OEW04_12300 [Nitrospirota bacterium]|nr:hypothetical protein [Nitrospirota bacterium]